jgi:hypothetical protein
VPRHDTTRAVLQEMRAMKKSRIGRRFLRRRSRDEIDGLPHHPAAAQQAELSGPRVP